MTFVAIGALRVKMMFSKFVVGMQKGMLQLHSNRKPVSKFAAPVSKSFPTTTESQSRVTTSATTPSLSTSSVETTPVTSHTTAVVEGEPVGRSRRPRTG